MQLRANSRVFAIEARNECSPIPLLGKEFQEQLVEGLQMSL